MVRECFPPRLTVFRTPGSPRRRHLRTLRRSSPFHSRNITTCHGGFEPPNGGGGMPSNPPPSSSQPPQQSLAPPSGGMGRGRGRANTLPAWMTRAKTASPSGPAGMPAAEGLPAAHSAAPPVAPPAASVPAPSVAPLAPGAGGGHVGGGGSAYAPPASNGGGGNNYAASNGGRSESSSSG